MRVSLDVVRALWERLGSEGRVYQMNLPDGQSEAIDLFAGPGGGSVLRSDGSIFDWDLDPRLEVVFRPSDQHSAVQALAIAARRLPELRGALPVRCEGAKECAACKGNGFLDLAGAPKFLVCDRCDGLGWAAA